MVQDASNNDQSDVSTGSDQQPEDWNIRDPETGGMATAFVDAVLLAIDVGDRVLARQLTQDLHEADLADLIEALPGSERSRLVALLGSDFDFAALTELDEGYGSVCWKTCRSIRLPRRWRDLTVMMQFSSWRICRLRTGPKSWTRFRHLNALFCSVH